MQPAARGKTFVGFGFGPIQSALFLLEAWRSGNFSRYVVAEIDPQLVKAVRANGGAYTINIARKDRVDQVRVQGIEIYNPADPLDREALLEAISEADEMATALPSVRFYNSGGPASAAGMLAEGAAGRSKPGILYAAENHNRAAELLAEAINFASPGIRLRNVQVLNTVIGKMSGVVDVAGAGEQSLAAMTPGAGKSILVEEFNRILISRIHLAGYTCGIPVFEQKDDLLPFEEAKLYGHNAIHALIGYLAAERGLETMAEAGEHADLMTIARRAFLEESGAALIWKYGKLGDPLFTPAGYQAYADDLLDRMTRPTLRDNVARVIRDPARKLAYDDRFFGTMRLALDAGIQPRNMAKGVAAAVRALLADADSLRSLGFEGKPRVDELLKKLWHGASDQWCDRLIQLIKESGDTHE